MRELVFGAEARNKLLQGVEIMYKAVCTTLGPRGRNVSIAREWGNPIIVHDGVTVARDVADTDEFVNMGINLVREAAQKTNDEAGDGTTTSTLLAYWLVQQGMQYIDKETNPMLLRNQLDEALKKVLAWLDTIAIKTDSHEDIARVASISSASEEIGELVAEAVLRVGQDGSVNVDESTTEETYVEYSEGLQLDHGWKSPYFITNPRTMESVIHDAAVVVIGKKITSQIEIVPLLEVLLRQTKNVVLFGDIDGVALKIAIQNKMQGVMNMLVVDPPGYEDRRNNLMEDIAIATGGKVVRDEIGLDMQEFANQFDIKYVGYADKVVASRKKTVIIGGGKDKEAVKKAVDERIDILRKQKELENNPYEQEKIEERLAKLSTGVAVIRVGAKTDVARREKEERVKDAVSSAQAAVAEGIVPGGGTTFLRLRAALNGENIGEKLLMDVLTQPLQKILVNAGEDESSCSTIHKQVSEKGGNYGYNMETGKIVDMVKDGIIDPKKVVRLALENAVSVAGSILTTDCLIAIKKDDDKNKD